MNGSFDSDQPKEATRKAGCGQDSALLELGDFFPLPPEGKMLLKVREEIFGLVKFFRENLCLLGLEE